MNEKLNSELVEIIKGSKDFVLAQAPEVFREAISQAVLFSSLTIVFSLCVAFVVYKAMLKYYEDSDGFSVFLGSIVLLCCAGSLYCNVGELITASCYPKLYLLETFLHIHS